MPKISTKGYQIETLDHSVLDGIISYNCIFLLKPSVVTRSLKRELLPVFECFCNVIEMNPPLVCLWSIMNCEIYKNRGCGNMGHFVDPSDDSTLLQAIG